MLASVQASRVGKVAVDVEEEEEEGWKKGNKNTSATKVVVEFGVSEGRP